MFTLFNKLFIDVYLDKFFRNLIMQLAAAARCSASWRNNLIFVLQ